MGKNGKLLNLNSDSPKYGNKSLVTKEQENELKRRKITFSFSYFKQIPNFQIGECSKGWHIGLLERLGALGTMTPQEVLEENRGSIALRCHPIDWSAKNIPIQRKDLDWLPKEILDNETDFPIMQFSITKSTGRIVGYFDRDSSIFHIVLLDPEHNIQPAKANSQKQTGTDIRSEDAGPAALSSGQGIGLMRPRHSACENAPHVHRLFRKRGYRGGIRIRVRRDYRRGFGRRRAISVSAA